MQKIKLYPTSYLNKIKTLLVGLINEKNELVWYIDPNGDRVIVLENGAIITPLMFVGED